MDLREHIKNQIVIAAVDFFNHALNNNKSTDCLEKLMRSIERYEQFEADYGKMQMKYLEAI